MTAGKKNIIQDTNFICTKAKKLYETFADSDDVHDSKEQDDAEPRPSMSAFHAEPSPINAHKCWFDKLQKYRKHRAEAYANNKFKVIIEEARYKPEQVFNMDEIGLFRKRMPSHNFKMQDEAKAPGCKAQKDCVTLFMCGNAAGFMIKLGLIDGLKIEP